MLVCESLIETLVMRNPGEASLWKLCVCVCVCVCVCMCVCVCVFVCLCRVCEALRATPKTKQNVSCDLCLTRRRTCTHPHTHTHAHTHTSRTYPQALQLPTCAAQTLLIGLASLKWEEESWLATSPKRCVEARMRAFMCTKHLCWAEGSWLLALPARHEDAAYACEFVHESGHGKHVRRGVYVVNACERGSRCWLVSRRHFLFHFVTHDSCTVHVPCQFCTYVMHIHRFLVFVRYVAWHHVMLAYRFCTHLYMPYIYIYIYIHIYIHIHKCTHVYAHWLYTHLYMPYTFIHIHIHTYT